MNTLWLYLSTPKVRGDRLGSHAAHRFHHRLPSWCSTSAPLLIAIGLFLLCTVPFWTSNIIRMISWIPLLGKQGLVNQALMGLGIVDEPMEWLLFSDFSVVVSYVPPLHAVHDRPDLQLDGAHRQSADRGGAGRGRKLSSHHVGGHYSALAQRHRARLDLRHRAGNGRFLHHQGDERRAERPPSSPPSSRTSTSCSIRLPRRARWCC